MMNNRTLKKFKLPGYFLLVLLLGCTQPESGTNYIQERNLSSEEEAELQLYVEKVAGFFATIGETNLVFDISFKPEGSFILARGFVEDDEEYEIIEAMLKSPSFLNPPVPFIIEVAIASPENLTASK